MDIPLVPGLGLYLDELYFDQYNVKQQLEKEKKEQVAKSSKRRATSGNAGFSVDQIKAAAVAAVNNALASANAPAVGVVVEESAAKDPADEVKEVPAPVPVPADADEGGEVVKILLILISFVFSFIFLCFLVGLIFVNNTIIGLSNNVSSSRYWENQFCGLRSQLLWQRCRDFETQLFGPTSLKRYFVLIIFICEHTCDERLHV